MRKVLSLIGAAALAVILSACDPDDQGASVHTSASYDVPPTTAGDPDGPAVDRPSGSPTSTPTASHPGTMTPSEAERFGSWDGTGDTPYGDDPDNDGRFSDIACDTFDDQGMTCRYGDGTIAAQDINYYGATWYWGTTPISDVGQCPAEDTSCSIVWDHAITSPVAVER